MAQNADLIQPETCSHFKKNRPFIGLPATRTEHPMLFCYACAAKTLFAKMRNGITPAEALADFYTDDLPANTVRLLLREMLEAFRSVARKNSLSGASYVAFKNMETR